MSAATPVAASVAVRGDRAAVSDRDSGTAGLAAALTQHRRHGAELPAALAGWQRRHLPAAIAAVQTGPRIGQRLGLG